MPTYAPTSSVAPITFGARVHGFAARRRTGTRARTDRRVLEHYPIVIARSEAKQSRELEAGLLRGACHRAGHFRAAPVGSQ
jgi:hypothetical protein